MVVVKIRGPFLGTLNNRCRIIIGTQKGTTPLALWGGVLHGFVQFSYRSLSDSRPDFWSPNLLRLYVVAVSGFSLLF